MKIRSVSAIAAGILAVIIGLAGVVITVPRVARATQADDTTIRITGYTPGATPFISNLHLIASDTSVIRSIQFKVVPKPNSIARPLSATYANFYLVDRGFENQQTGEITLPVYGLYDGYSNLVRLTYRFVDGSSRGVNMTISTATFNETCGYKELARLQPRSSAPLSYDYFLIKSSCSDFSPAVIDSDGALRWVGTAGISSVNSAFFNNAFYIAGTAPRLFRLDLDGAVTQVADFSNVARYSHHNIDVGKVGLILDINTDSYFESVNIEVDPYSGRIVKTWNLAEIISAAMRAGGDDPSQFVYPAPTDWFHNNSVAYNRADDSIIVSSRENFVICLDYETGAIKWILGDPTKKWYQFPSLRRFALTLAPGSHPPIGQHAISITFDQNILLFDNGQCSVFQNPQGQQRNYSSPRKYKLDLNARTATEVWNSEFGQSLWCPYCGSVYEDGPFNYLIDYTFADGVVGGNSLLQLVGLNSPENTVFRYQYPSLPGCHVGFNSIPIHLENTMFPTVGPEALNLSTRGTVSSGDNVLINGFIISGDGAKTVILRALGPSLERFGVSGALADPSLSLYDSSGHLIGSNDNWQTDPGSAYIEQNGFAPDDPAESATLRTLMPGVYTAVVRGRNGSQGVSLAEIYRLNDPGHTSKLANVSGRGFVGTGDNVLISGLIIGDVGSGTVIVRALGPSLASFGVNQPLADPTLTIYDSNGVAIATNDNWRSDNNSVYVQRNGLAPPNPLESAIVLRLPAGAYTAVVSGVDGGTGNALLEVYHID